LGGEGTDSTTYLDQNAKTLRGLFVLALQQIVDSFIVGLLTVEAFEWLANKQSSLIRLRPNVPIPLMAGAEHTQVRYWLLPCGLSKGSRLRPCRSESITYDGRKPFALIAWMALAMGTRNAAVRKLAIPDLTTTVLTLTITGIAGDSLIANGNNPRFTRRVESVVAMFLGAALGAVIIHYSISAALWLGTAISALCSAALFPSLRTSEQL
jgi:cellobiose-specific phosphotransferase system component IIC